MGRGVSSRFRLSTRQCFVCVIGAFEKLWCLAACATRFSVFVGSPRPILLVSLVDTRLCNAVGCVSFQRCERRVSRPQTADQYDAFGAKRRKLLALLAPCRLWFGADFKTPHCVLRASLCVCVRVCSRNGFYIRAHWMVESLRTTHTIDRGRGNIVAAPSRYNQYCVDLARAPLCS
jgi:hypothetical protein